MTKQLIISEMIDSCCVRAFWYSHQLVCRRKGLSKSWSKSSSKNKTGLTRTRPIWRTISMSFWSTYKKPATQPILMRREAGSSQQAGGWMFWPTIRMMGWRGGARSRARTSTGRSGVAKPWCWTSSTRSVSSRRSRVAGMVLKLTADCLSARDYLQEIPVWGCRNRRNWK